MIIMGFSHGKKMIMMICLVVDIFYIHIQVQDVKKKHHQHLEFQSNLCLISNSLPIFYKTTSPLPQAGELLSLKATPSS